MNKKGSMANITGLMTLFVLVLVCVSLIQIQQSSVSPDDVLKILSDTENKTLQNFKITEDNSLIVNVLYSYLGFLIYSAVEITKAAVQYAVANPEYINPITLLWLIIIALLAPVVIITFKLILIIVILIKDVVQSKKEKKRLDELRKNES